MKRVLILFLFLVATAMLALSHLNAAQEKGKMPSLEDTFRALMKGAASEKQELRENAVRSTLPKKADIEFLFPKHAEVLWPKWEKQIKMVHDNADEQARQMTKRGPVSKVTILDVRNDPRLAKQYKWILEVIPKGVPIAECVYELETGKGRMQTFFLVGNRWIVIRDLEGFALEN
jgi:hypothetical protein